MDDKLVRLARRAGIHRVVAEKVHERIFNSCDNCLRAVALRIAVVRRVATELFNLHRDTFEAIRTGVIIATRAA